MSIDDIYSKIAKEHGVTATEVKKEIQAAIDHAYKNPDKTLQQSRMQAAISRSGETPTTEELIAHVIRQIK